MITSTRCLGQRGGEADGNGERQQCHRGITGDTTTITPDVAELSLNVGSNTLTVTVTAEDTTELIYTITVERAAIPTLVSNTNQTSIGDSAHFHAQIFETGANADGYTVSEVDVYLVSGSGRSM